VSNSANVSSVDAIRLFAAAVAKFQEEARLCLTMMDSQLRQILFWLERDRPSFWKHEFENCMREVAEARVRLHQCRMRKMGDFRPSCIEEVKHLEKCKNDVEFAQKQVPNVKRWFGEATHEGEEYRGRAAQLTQAVDRDLPRLLALLAFTIDRLEAYASITSPNAVPDATRMAKISEELQAFLKSIEAHRENGVQPDDVVSQDAVAEQNNAASETA
jgi:hypothetical protein